MKKDRYIKQRWVYCNPYSTYLIHLLNAILQKRLGKCLFSLSYSIVLNIASECLKFINIAFIVNCDIYF